jgi:hypothetical protein
MKEAAAEIDRLRATSQPTNAQSALADCEFMPLSLEPLADPNFDPGEHQVMDAEDAHIFKIIGSRERAELIIAALNRTATSQPTDAAREALEKISGRREYDATDHENAARYKPGEGRWTTDEYLADAALGPTVEMGGDARGALPVVKAAGDEYQRCMDMLGDVPGITLEQRLTHYIGCYMALQIEVGSASPSADARAAAIEAVSNPLRDALMKGFLTTSTNGSSHEITIEFDRLENMQEARKELYHAIRHRPALSQAPALAHQASATESAPVQSDDGRKV